MGRRSPAPTSQSTAMGLDSKEGPLIDSQQGCQLRCPSSPMTSRALVHTEEVASYLARLDEVGFLLHQLQQAVADGQVSALLARDPVAQADAGDPIALLELLDALRDPGANGQDDRSGQSAS